MGSNENLIHELETAAQILLAAPNVVNSEQRHAAENVFLQFRRSTQQQSAFQLAKDILETSKVDYVLFEAAGLVKDAVIRQWDQMPTDDIMQLRSYLLQYVISHATLSGYVRERLVQVMAIVIKRQSVVDMGEDRKRVLAEVQALIANGNMQMQMVGCSILGAMLQEYATTIKSSDMGLPWEVHFKAKKQFEASDLRSIFEFCVRALQELASTDGRIGPGMPQEVSNLVLRLCTLSESVLSWTFINIHLPKKLISVFELDQNPSLRPGASWRDIILQPSIASLFFQLHTKIRHDSELSHHTLNCLVQLASLNGTVLAKKEDRLQYIANFLPEFLRLVHFLKDQGSMQPNEALGCSNIVRKLMLFFPPSVLVKLEPTLLQEYLRQLTELTCHFMKATTLKSALDDDSSLYGEALDHMLEAWVSVLQEHQSFSQDFRVQSATEMFNTYVQCHLAAPDGIRGVNGGDEEDEIDEAEETDRTKYKDALAIIGALGREIPGHSLNVLSQLLDSRLSRLHGQLQRLITNLSRNIDKVLADLYEDIHWLLLITGNVLMLDTDGEAALIPPEIMRFSLDQAPHVNLEASLRVLASPGQPCNQIPGFESADPVLRLVSCIFRLSEIEKRTVEAGFPSLLSPEVSSSVMWFLRRWTATYLLVQENFYAEISMAIVTAFGQNTEGAAWLTNYLLGKVISNLTTLHSEPLVVQDTILTLVALVDSKEKGIQVLKCEKLVDLIALQSSPDAYVLPPSALRGLMKALVIVGAACEDQASRDQYWDKVLKPLGDRFQSLILKDNIKQVVYQDEKVQNAFVSLLEALIGIVQGAHISTVQQLFHFIQPILANLVSLLSLYHNYNNMVELILEVFGETARRILCYLPRNDSRLLYQSSVDCIRTYAHHNLGKRSVKPMAKETEEEQFRDLLLLMEMLTNLLSKDIIDLAPQEDGDDDGVTAADVCLHGLNIIMPLMSQDLLKFPSLCLQYFKTVTLVAEIFPDKICNLNPELQRNLIASLELGLTSIGVDTVFVLCCDFIQVLCCFMLRAKQTHLPLYESFRPFLKLILDLILSQNVNSDLLPYASSTFYVLICCFKNTYDDLVNFLVANQPDDASRQRLNQAFNDLLQNIPLTADRVNRIKFRDNSEKFIINVRSFLFVK